MCDSKELLVGYLYGELDAAGRRAFEAHVPVCPECRDEVAGLRVTRGFIAAWSPPEPDLGLRLVRGAAAPPAPRIRSLPTWGLAAAAAIVLAASAAIANIEVRYDQSGVTLRTGWGRAPGAPASAALGLAAAPAPVAASIDFAAFDRRLQQLEQASDRAPAAAATQASDDRPGPRMSDDELLRRVRLLIGEAEGRNQREMALVLAQLVKDFDRQRRTDIAMLQQGFGQLQGMTNAEIAQLRDGTNQLMRLAVSREK